MSNAPGSGAVPIADVDALVARNVSKSFAGARVLDRFELRIGAGEVVALVGANGAGKSTFTKIVTGIYTPDPGAFIQVGGRQVGVDRGAARQIRVVHQEAPLVPTQTIAEYVGLALGFPAAFGMVRSRQLHRRAEQLLRDVDVFLDPEREAKTLTGAERAAVHLAIALASGADEPRLLVLDEATASLTDRESTAFLSRVASAAANGVGVMMVTHRLHEVREWCDRVVVLRDGVIVHQAEARTEDPRAIVRHMMGAPTVSHADSGSAPVRAAGADASPRLRATGIVGGAARGASFEVAPGEILGLVGRRDDGVADVMRLITGLDPLDSGSIEVDGVAVPMRHPRDAVRNGIFYLSANRLEEGGLPAMSVSENLTMPRAERYWRGGAGARRADVGWAMEELGILPPDPEVEFDTLSGGNQQKVILARWLLLGPRLLVLDDPTQGVDTGTRERLFSMLTELSTQGVAVVLASTEPEQIARMCHRTVVIEDGIAARELVADQLNIEEISLASFH